MGKRAGGIGVVPVLAGACVILGLILIAATFVSVAKERELYQIGKVVDAQVVAEERYTARTMKNIFDYDGLTDLSLLEEEGYAVRTRRTRYRYQLYADGIRFTLRNRPGTQRLQTGNTVAITYDPDNVSNFRLFMGKPQPNIGVLVSGIGLLAAGALLSTRFKLW